MKLFLFILIALSPLSFAEEHCEEIVLTDETKLLAQSLNDLQPLGSGALLVTIFKALPPSEVYVLFEQLSNGHKVEFWKYRILQ